MFVNRPLAVLATCGLSMSVGSASAQDTPVTFDHFAEEKVYSPYVDRTFPDRILWGNTHLHTNLSPDAGLVGTTLGPEEAYRFARGEQVVSSTGKRVALIRPLDWLVVSDHAEYIGLAPMIRQSDPLLLADPYGKWLHERFSAGQEGRMEAFQSILRDAAIGNNRFSSSDATRSIWERFAKIADAYDEPGRFSAFIGFEWSSMPSGNNLHRVVIFRDSAERATQVLPFSLFDSDDPEDLWKYMAGYEAKTGGSVLAIPHNGNLSNGQMFAE